jgi:hypothetical protein
LSEAPRIGVEREPHLIDKSKAELAAMLSSGHNEQSKLMGAVTGLKRRLEDMVNKNEAAAPLERLSRLEFVVDLDMQLELEAKAEAGAARARLALEDDHQGKELIVARIREQCWDAMETNGVVIEGLKATISVHNYPVRRLTILDKQKQSKIEFLRKMHLMEDSWIQQNPKINDEIAEEEYVIVISTPIVLITCSSAN